MFGGQLDYIGQPFKNGAKAGQREPRAIRIDGVATVNGQPMAVIDHRFGKAVLSGARVAQIRAHLPESLKKLPIVALRPNTAPVIFAPGDPKR